MHRQVGDLEMDKAGVARRGLLVRHLVLPNGQAGTQEVVRFLAQEISKNTYLNVMAQYHPCYQADNQPVIARPVQQREVTQAITLAHQQGLRRLDRKESRVPLRILLR